MTHVMTTFIKTWWFVPVCMVLIIIADAIGRGTN